MNAPRRISNKKSNEPSTSNSNNEKYNQSNESKSDLSNQSRDVLNIKNKISQINDGSGKVAQESK